MSGDWFKRHGYIAARQLATEDPALPGKPSVHRGPPFFLFLSSSSIAAFISSGGQQQQQLSHPPTPVYVLLSSSVVAHGHDCLDVGAFQMR